MNVLVFRARGFFGIRLGPVYVSVRSSEHRAYFSERNRIKTRVLGLPFGWRIVARRDGHGA